MSEDADLPDGENEQETSPEGEVESEPHRPSRGDANPSLNLFASVQRMLASIDSSAIQAAQRAIEGADTFKKIVEAQDAIATNFVRSLDFSRIAATHKAIADTGTTAQAIEAQKQWAAALAESIDFSALERAVESSAALDQWARTSAAYSQSFREQTEFLARIAGDIPFKLPTIDTAKLIAALDRWIPANLRGVAALEVVAKVAFEEGLPLSWVPRTELVLLLIEADGPDARVGILTEHRDDILDDCENALDAVESEWAVQCRSAVAAMRGGHDRPAQSHASNIIDSILRGLDEKGRQHARRGGELDLDELPLQLAAENLTIRPLFRALTPWYPNSGIRPPDYFSRHTTSHAAGHPGVFTSTAALLAVMLATSLVVQYAPSTASNNDSETNSAQ